MPIPHFGAWSERIVPQGCGNHPKREGKEIFTMRRSARKPLKIGLLFVLVATAAISATAFTAANTVPASNAGDGSAVISGYTITAVGYTINATNPQNLDAVNFTISPATAGTVRAQVQNAGSWYNCTNTAGAVSCATTAPQATVLAADQLTVVATD